MNGQEVTNALSASKVAGASSNAKSNGLPPTGAVNSNSWLKDIMADPMRAAQAGIINAPNALSSHFDRTAALPQTMPFHPAMSQSYNPLMLMSQLHQQQLGEHAATVSTSATNPQHLLMPTVSSNNFPLNKAFSQRLPSGSTRESNSLKHSAAPSATSDVPAKLTKTDDSNLATSPSNSAGATGDSSIPHRPDYFRKGSIIQLGDNKLKRIEDLQTSDFESSAHSNSNLSLDCSTVVNFVERPHRGTASITFSVGSVSNHGADSHDQFEATVEATLEHPFFVYNQGWCSVSPERTLNYYKLDCHRLKVHDRCISLTFKEGSIPSSSNLES